MLLFKALSLFLLTPYLWASQWQVGDVILQPKRCYLCGYIEAHENSIFSHMSVVVSVKNNEVIVAESLTKVRLLSLEDFLKLGDNRRHHKAIRLIEVAKLDLMKEVRPLLGADYDSDFRWDNLGRDGREALYCSELVAKIMNPFLSRKIPTKIMDYSLNFDFWNNYFQGNIPQGLEGNSPGDFEKSPLFFEVARYEDGQWNWK